MRIVITNGRLFDPATKLDVKQDIYIAEGKIAGIEKKPDGFTHDLNINANNKLIVPGLVDLCARLREPGQTNKGTFQSELLAANSNGITSVCCPPDTKPVIDTTAVVELIHQRARDTRRANVYPLGALTQGLRGEQLAEMYMLKQAGCIGVSNALMPIDNTEVLRRAFEYAQSCDLTVFIFSEDSMLKNNGVVHEGPISTRLGLPAIPETAETIAVSKVLLLTEQTNVRVHFCRLSSMRSVTILKEAQAQGLPVTADVGICNLHLTEADIINFNSNCHLQPPLRSEHDRKGLIKGIMEGTVAAICSDHQPHDADAKAAPFSLTEPGASTIEHLLPLVLHLVRKDELSLEVGISALTSQPAKILGIDKGTLGIGRAADICIIDPDQFITIEKNTLLSTGKNSLFNGWKLPGKVTHTLLDGNIVFDQM